MIGTLRALCTPQNIGNNIIFAFGRVLILLLFATVCTLLTAPRAALAEYACGSIFPQTGVTYSADSAQEKIVGPQCLFTVLNEPDTNALVADVYAMSLDAMKTIGLEASLTVDRVEFSYSARMYVVGFTEDQYRELDDGTSFAGLRVNILLMNVLSWHNVDTLPAGFIFQNRFPPWTNITIVNSHFEYQILSSPAHLTESIEAVLVFNFAFGFKDHSALKIENNTFSARFVSVIQLEFEFDAYRALIEARHRYSEEYGVTTSTGEQTINGNKFFRFTTAIVFMGNLLLSDSSSVLIIRNTFSFLVTAIVEEAESLSIFTSAIAYLSPLECVESSHFLIHKNEFYYDVTQIANSVHEASHLSVASVDFTESVALLGDSSFQTTQNRLEYKVVQMSNRAQGEGLHDERLKNRILTSSLGVIKLSNSLVIADNSSFIFALNGMTIRHEAFEGVPDDRNPPLTSGLSAVITHSEVWVENSSLYYAHGNSVALNYVCLPNSNMVSTVAFLRFEEGVSVANSSHIVIGCANPHLHPLEDARPVAGGSAEEYSYVYESTIGEVAAHRLNGNLFNASSYKAYVSKIPSRNRGTNQSDESGWWLLGNDDSLLGKAGGSEEGMLKISLDKCYINNFRATAYQLDTTKRSYIGLGFIGVLDFFAVVNHSLFLAARNSIILLASSSYDDTLLTLFFFSRAAFRLTEDSATAYQGQFIVTDTLAEVPSASSQSRSAPSSPSDSLCGEGEKDDPSISLPSFLALVTNQLTRTWEGAIGSGFSLVEIVSYDGIWVKGQSALLCENNTVALLANPPSYYFHNSRIKEFSFSEDGIASIPKSARVSMDPASPFYDPYYMFKNATGGFISIIAVFNSYFANPDGRIIVNENAFVMYNRSLLSNSSSKPGIIDFGGYTDVRPDQMPSNVSGIAAIPPSEQIFPERPFAHFERSWGYSPYVNSTVALEKMERDYWLDDDGLPLFFPSRRGPPLLRALDWFSHRMPDEVWTDLWRSSLRVEREIHPWGHTVLLKNETRCGTSSPSSFTPTIPWSNSLSVQYCHGVINGRDVTFREIVSGMKRLVKDDGTAFDASFEHHAAINANTTGFSVINGCPKSRTSTTVTQGLSSSLSQQRTAYSTSSSISSPISAATQTYTKSASLAVHNIVVEERDSGLRDAQKQTADLVGGLVGVVGTTLSGATSLQLSVGNALLRMSDCRVREVVLKDGNATVVDEGEENAGDENLPVLVHPLRFSVWPSEPFHQERGAVLGNLAIAAASVSFVRFVVIHVVGRCLNPGEDASAIVGWPSAVALPFVALSEGTASSATALLRSLAWHREEAERADPIEELYSNTTTTVVSQVQAGLPSAAMVINAVLGLAGLAALIFVGASWTYIIVAVIPRGHVVLRRQPSVSSFVSRLITPVYAYAFKGNNNNDIINSGRIYTCRRIDVGEDREVHAEAEVACSSLSSVRDEEGCQSFALLTDGDDDSKIKGCSSSNNSNNKHQGTASPSGSVGDRSEMEEEEVMTALERHCHLIGDRFFIYTELLCFVLAVCVGVSEGLGDGKTELCKARVIVAAVAAFAQVALNALSTIPLDMLIQSFLGLSTAALAVLAVMRVYTDGGMSVELAETIDLVSTVGNLLGLAALGVEVLSVARRLFRARDSRQKRHLDRMRRNLLSRTTIGDVTEIEVNFEREVSGRLYLDEDEELFSFTRGAEKGRSKRPAKKHEWGTRGEDDHRSHAFQANLNAFLDEDLDLFLLDAEEEAMRVDELELSLELET